MSAAPLQVTLLTLQDCHLCDRARDVLAQLGRDRPVVVEETAWESAEGQRLVQRDRIPFAPAVYIDGSFAAYGRISDGALRRWLSKREPGSWLPRPWRRRTRSSTRAP